MVSPSRAEAMRVALTNSAPCGLTRAGLPFGVQVIGGAHGERDLFAHAAWLEGLFAFTPPPLALG